MITADDPLPDDLEAAHQLIRELLATLGTQIHLDEELQHQLEQLLRHRFGRKTERVDPAQLLLFAQEILAQAEPAPTPDPSPEPAPRSAPVRSASPKNGHGRKPLPASLPRRPVVHDVPPERLPCPECGTLRQQIGVEVREQLEYIPATLVVLEHRRPKYACPGCKAHVVIAERFAEPIEKGLPGPGLMAHVATSKYADHLPLYRQEGIYQRLGVDISRATMCDWMATAAELLAPIVACMLEKVASPGSSRTTTRRSPCRTTTARGPRPAGSGRPWGITTIGTSSIATLQTAAAPDRQASSRVMRDTCKRMPILLVTVYILRGRSSKSGA